jgi:acyl-CoA dehydrogenase
MNLDFSDEQKMLADHARQFLSETCTFDRLREFVASGEDYDRALWQQMVELGWPGLSVPEAVGGLGLGDLELCVLSEEIGRVLAPVPFFSTVCQAAPLLAEIGSADANDWLVRIAAGGCTVAVANPDQGGKLQLDGAGQLSGTLAPVAWLHCAELLLVTVTSADGEAVLLAVALEQAGVQRDRLVGQVLDSVTAWGQADFQNAATQVLARGEQVASLNTVLRLRSAVLMAFEQLGGATSACSMARDYSLERYTFGRQIGGYQAIKHKLAEVRVALELARSNAYYGAWALYTQSPELPRAAALARLSGTETFTLAAEENLQVHGGIGYTWEANCHFYYQRARLLAVALGGPDQWAAELLESIQ